MSDKELRELLGVDWQNSAALELGERLVTIIGRGRALQMSDARIMRDIMNYLAENGYGKMVACKDYAVGCGGHCCSDLEKFESIKVDGE
jgi:hypothetical protein